MIELNKAYLFHTHLGIWLGVVVEATLDEARLNTCSWVHKQGRMGASVRNGTLDNHEYLGDGIVIPLQGSIKVPWKHKMPTADK